MKENPRFKLTEIEGFDSIDMRSSRSNQGLSVQILDTAFNHKVVWNKRTETDGRITERHMDRIRWEALVKLSELNGTEPPVPFKRWRAGFRATCPSCNRRLEASVDSCKCGFVRRQAA